MGGWKGNWRGEWRGEWWGERRVSGGAGGEADGGVRRAAAVA